MKNMIVIAALGLAAMAQAVTASEPSPGEVRKNPAASGISGPGGKVVGNGREPWNKDFPGRGMNRKCNNSTMEKGLLPPIKPLAEIHVRDTIITLGGDGNYYLTGSTGDDIWDFNDGVELWRSPDLQNWEYVGLVWDVRKDGTWEKDPRDLHGKPTVTVWAPEIHYLPICKKYVIVLSMAPSGISMLVSDKPEGPYVNYVKENNGRLCSGIDATIFEDDDGKIYFSNGPASRISLVKPDFSGFEETHETVLLNPDLNPAHHAKKIVARGMKGFGHEGACLFKANGWYYLGAVDDYEGRYSQCVARSRNVWGPYDHWQETVPCGGGTNFFQDKEGKWWCAFFGNDRSAPWMEKAGAVRVKFDADGKILVDEQPAWNLVD